jgi:hypothetical protein
MGSVGVRGGLTHFQLPPTKNFLGAMACRARGDQGRRSRRPRILAGVGEFEFVREGQIHVTEIERIPFSLIGEKERFGSCVVRSFRWPMMPWAGAHCFGAHADGFGPELWWAEWPSGRPYAPRFASSQRKTVSNTDRNLIFHLCSS